MRQIKNKEIVKKEIRSKRPIVNLQIYLIISITFITALSFSVLNTETVSAQSSMATNCCVPDGTGSNAACTDILASECDSTCDGSCQSTLCSQVSQCVLGCGFDTSEGVCTPNTPKTLCENEEDCEWFDDPFCNINQCEQGCCLLGNNAQFTTETQCQTLSERNGLPYEFDSSITTPLACLNSANALKEGACVFPSTTNEDGKNNCKFTTQSDCAQNINGAFYEGSLCSNPELNTMCERQERASCSDGKDEIYWFDSCGNRENIYQSDKDQSWNSGKVLAESQSCNPNSNNANSGTCGNCNYELGSICGSYRPGTDNGNMEGYTCRDLNCVDSEGTRRINGESWCVYDGQIGKQEVNGVNEGEISADTVGSRHIREVCINGDVQVEQCADYRKEICVESEKELSNGRNIDSAICRVNLWDQCLTANSEGSEMGSCDSETECARLCNENPDCRIQTTHIDSGFKFNTCVPNYPPGFNLASTSSGGQSLLSGSDVCSLATRTCVVVYKKNFDGDWKCIENCDCESKEFTEQMNNLCVSLGDCGAYSNFNGDITDGGYSVTKKGGKAKAPPKFKLVDLEKLYGSMFEDDNSQNADPGFFDEEEDILDLNDHGLGDPFLVGYISEGPDPLAQPGFLEQYQPAIIAGVVATAVTTILANIGGGAAGLLGQATILNGILGPLAVSLWGAVIVVAVVILVMLLGIGKTKVSQITFQCEPWSRPYGGDSCDVCGSDGKPCTKYRCESLGTRCQLVNENTGRDECISIEGEVGNPILSSWDGALNNSLYKYQDETTSGFRVRKVDGSCIQAFTPLSFGVETDILAQCKYSFEDIPYDEMSSNFLDGNIFSKNHTLLTVMPSVDSLIASEINPGESINSSDYQYLLDQIGDLNFHIKCASLDGDTNEVDYRINFCVDPGPDLTPPVVTATIPADNGVLAFNSENVNSVIYINEPAECKYSTSLPGSPDPLTNFNLLNNNLECPSDADGATLLGYPCTVNLPVTGVDNKYYIMCRDQPWLLENSSRNVGSIFEYNLKKSVSELKIISLTPSGEIFQGSEPLTINLEATTSGGSNNGIAQCEYSFDNINFIDFFETNKKTHKQILNQMTSGEYDLAVKCVDNAGNIAQNQTHLKLSLDTQEPSVTRVFKSGGNLIINTNEDARCFYKTEGSCSYAITNSTEMSRTSSGMIHSTPWQEDKTYSIKCKDIWDNTPNACSIEVKPYSL